MALYMGSMRICTSVEGEMASGDTKSIVRYSGLNVVPQARFINCTSQNEYTFDEVKYVHFLSKSSAGNAFSAFDVKFEKDSRNYIRLDCNGSYTVYFRIYINNVAIANINVGSTHDLDTYTDVLVEFDFILNIAKIIGAEQGTDPVTVFTIDFSQYDISAIDTFYIKTMVGRWGGYTYAQSVFINNKTDYTSLMNFHFQYGQYNAIPSYALTPQCYPATLVQAGYDAEQTVEVISPTHKIITANITNQNYFPMGSYNPAYTTQDGYIMTKFRVTEITTSCNLSGGAGIDANYFFDAETGDLVATNTLTPELNKWYLLISHINNTPSYASTYAVKAQGQFKLETVGMYLYSMQSINLCAETCGGLYFSGAIPFNTDKIYFTTPTFLANAGWLGRKAPIYSMVVTTNGGIYMYNGTAWKVIGT